MQNCALYKKYSLVCTGKPSAWLGLPVWNDHSLALYPWQFLSPRIVRVANDWCISVQQTVKWVVLEKNILFYC